MHLRDVTLDDLDLYFRMRCDPVMMAELGGPLPSDGVPDKLRRDVEAVERDEYWISIVVSDDDEPMGSVVLWRHDDHGEEETEIGWMVLPEFQGRGIGRAATAALIERARADGRWGDIHAYPGVTNAPSNGICRSLGFELVGAMDVIAFEDRPLRVNHWRLSPGSDPVMEQRVSLVTLGVADVARARAFYERLGWRPGLDVEETVFFQAGGLIITLWSREKLASDSVVDDPGGWGGVTLAHNVRSRAQVDHVIQRASEAGARITREPAETFYGGYAGVFVDPDGHPWEIAYNPGFTLDDDGNIRLPAS